VNIERQFAVSVSLQALGTHVAQTSLLLLVLTSRDANAADSGLVSALGTLPYLFLSLPFGAVLDRGRPSQWLRRMAILRAFLMAVGAFLLALNPTLGSFLALAVVGGAMSCMSTVSVQPTIARLFRDKEQQAGLATALTQWMSVAQMIGYLLAGLLAQAFGPYVFLVNSLIFLVAWILSPRCDEGVAAPSGRIALVSLVSEGMRYSVSSPVVFLLLAFLAAWSFGQAFVIAGLYPLLLKEVGRSQTYVSVFLAATALGAICASMLMRRALALVHHGLLLSGCFLGMFFCWTVIALTANKSTAWPVFCGFVVGMLMGPCGVLLLILRQSAVALEYQGRFSALASTATWSLIPIGSVLGGVVASHWGGVAAILVGAAVFLFALLLFTMNSAITLTRDFSSLRMNDA
jgi:predicted MFS family arabinose efflux permease